MSYGHGPEKKTGSAADRFDPGCLQQVFLRPQGPASVTGRVDQGRGQVADRNDIVIQPDRREVRVNGAPVTLGARAFDVLRHLHENEGRVVTKQELLEQVWGGLAVEEGNLSVQISSLRKILGARAISTVPGVGYQLSAQSDGDAAADARPSLPLPARPSLAVLPFANLTGDAGNEYLVDGIVTDLIGSLSRISGIFVIAATSSFAFKGRAVDLADVGRDLGVRYVLEGSIQRAGETLRISVQLVEAETSHTIWNQKFSGPVAEIFELQDRITEEVTGALEPTLIFAEARRSQDTPTDNMAAYDLCLRAMTHILRMPKVDNFRQAIALLDQAVALDPNYTMARAWKCRAYLMARGGRYITMDEMRRIEAEAKALLADHRPVLCGDRLFVFHQGQTPGGPCRAAGQGHGAQFRAGSAMLGVGVELRRGLRGGHRLF